MLSLFVDGTQVLNIRIFRSAFLKRLDPCPHTPVTELVRSRLWHDSGRGAFVCFKEPQSRRLRFACILAWLTADLSEGTFAFAEEWKVRLRGETGKERDFDGYSFASLKPVHQPHVPVRRSKRLLIPASEIRSRVVFLASATNAAKGWVTTDSHRGFFEAPEVVTLVPPPAEVLLHT
jgi:hypothetical protein